MEYFKYLSPDRADVLESLKIRYTQATDLNDPFEAFPAVIDKSESWFMERFLRIIKNEAAQHSFGSPTKREQYIRDRKKEFPTFYRKYSDHKWLSQQAIKIVMLDAHVQGYLSLSRTDKNVLMWSHYAADHKGFVIGFDVNHDYFRRSVEHVKYSDQRPLLNPLQSEQDASLFFTKSRDWAYEQEVRKCANFIDPIPLENGNKLLPYPEFVPRIDDPIYTQIRLFDYPKDSIKSVTFGWKSTNIFLEKIVSLLAFHGLSKVQIRQATPHSRKYEMVVREI